MARMTLTTSKGKTFSINWAWAPVGLFQNQLMINLEDPRGIVEIAEDFTGCEYFDRKSELEGDKHWDAYTELVGVTRDELRNDMITVTLKEPSVK